MYFLLRKELLEGGVDQVQGSTCNSGTALKHDRGQVDRVLEAEYSLDKRTWRDSLDARVKSGHGS